MQYILDITAMGRQIARVEAPKVRLCIKTTQGRVRARSYWLPKKRLVVWNPADGLEGLFHELAHVQLGHTAEGMRLGKPNAQELQAWKRAEVLSMKWGIAFNYSFADWCLMTHTPSVEMLTDSFRVEWRFMK